MRQDERHGRTPGAVRFGVFDVDLEARELRRNGIKVWLQEQPFHILALFVTRPGQILTREELQERLWQRQSLVDAELGLNTAIRKIRSALGDSADNPRFVETLPKRGYRFIAPVREIERSGAGDEHGLETPVSTASSFQKEACETSSAQPSPLGTPETAESQGVKAAGSTLRSKDERFEAIAHTSRPQRYWHYWVLPLLLGVVGLSAVVRRIEANGAHASRGGPRSQFRTIYGATHPGLGIGGYDLKSLNDRLFAFDYDHSGKLDYLVLYRPGAGSIWIVKNSQGTFSSLYLGNGIGGYELKSPNDRMFAFDYDHSGKLDHLVVYQAGTGILRIFRNDNDGIFTPVHAELRGGPVGPGASNFQSIDQAFAFDYDHSGKLDHLVLYRGDNGTLGILKNAGESMVWVYPKWVSRSAQSRSEFSACQAFAFDYDHSGKLDHLVFFRPGTGTISILKNAEGALIPVYQGRGIGGYDLRSPLDQVMPFDYDQSGKLDYLILYRPGTGMIGILKNSGGVFSAVYQGKGVGEYDLNSPNDRILAFDYEHIARLDHLVLYRPATGILYILQKRTLDRARNGKLWPVSPDASDRYTFPFMRFHINDLEDHTESMYKPEPVGNSELVAQAWESTPTLIERGGTGNGAHPIYPGKMKMHKRLCCWNVAGKPRSWSSRIIVGGLIALVMTLLVEEVRPAFAQKKDPQDQSASGGEGSRPEHVRRKVYFYPPFSSDFVGHEFDQNAIVRNATADVSTVDDMAGIAIIIYWSQLCPIENQCNFDMIDKILEFWNAQGKKVILSVSVTGPPIERITATGKEFASATPDWVLRQVATFQSPSNNFIGLFPDWRQMANNPRFTFPFPRYDDPRFVAEIGKLIFQLGQHYDGRPGLAYVRIGAGKAGEDNPIGRSNGFGPGTGMPGFTNHIWINYSRKVADFYRAGFPRTRLEFNFDWMAIVAARAKNVTPITPREQTEAQVFLDDLLRRNIFLAFDGGPTLIEGRPNATALNPTGATCSGFSPQADAETPPTLAAAYAEVEHLQQMGVAFGFEVSALSSACSAPKTTSAILRRYQPERIIFFGDTAALINFLHQGKNLQNEWAVENATNFLVPFTNLRDLPAHEMQAEPEIKRFARRLDRIIEKFLSSSKG